MRKQELVHLHGVLVEVTQSLVEQDAVQAAIWDEYQTLDITAAAIHAQKSDHQKAVLLLAPALGTELEDATEEQPAMSVR